MTIRESIESALRNGPWKIDQYARLVFWLSQEDWVQLAFEFNE